MLHLAVRALGCCRNAGLKDESAETRTVFLKARALQEKK